MAKKKVTIEWRNTAANDFYDILEYLKEESELAVSIVGNFILDEIDSLTTYPKKYPIDRFKKNNNGNYRAFVVYNYRISYLIEEDTVYILRIRHTSREPLEH